MKKFLSCLLLVSLSFAGNAQVHAALFRFPDVSRSQIVFTYANDIWVVSKTGGTAIRLSSPPGVESFPKFSPDGKSIAFTANYDGNNNVYVMPVTGGVPTRVTYHGGTDRVVDWTNDGKDIYFASIRQSGKARFNQFYTIAPTGGPAKKMPLPYAEWGSYSPDGKQMALTFRSQAFRNWKRYRGGWNADIYLFNFTNQASENITADNDAANEFPMWHGNEIYLLSDRGPEKRMNLWKYSLANKSFEQLTHYTDYDVHFPSQGPDDIVYEAGGELYLFNFASQKASQVNINLISDRARLKPTVERVDRLIQNAGISPDGKRVLIEARGDLFSLPAEEGYVENLTHSSGVADRYPSWSPDGKSIAWWNDSSGEYELWVMPTNHPESARKLTSYGPGFRYSLHWSPDNKKIAFIDKAGKIKIYDIASNLTFDVDQGLRYTEGNLRNFDCSWSPDSRWLAYDRDLENQHTAVFIYDSQLKQSHQITSGFYSCGSPSFDPKGKYLYLLTGQSFNPYYSDFQNTWIYANSTQVAAISLERGTPSLLAPKNDTVAVKAGEEKKEGPNGKEKNNAKAAAKKGGNGEVEPVAIDLDGLEDRMVILPITNGNIRNLKALKGSLLYVRLPNTGAGDGHPAIKIFNLDKKEEKTVLEGAGRYWLAANGEKILVARSNEFAVINPSPGQKIEKTVPIHDMQMTVDPMQEWKQLFTDAWRIERDYFYDSHMHGVDWNGVREKYMKLINDCLTREDVDFVLGEMVGELNSSHTYHGGGDLESTRHASVGYLGINWEPAGKYYKVKEIIRGAPWDAEVHSPLDEPGIDIKEGMYVLAVNGIPVTTDQEPYAAFQGLAGKTVELTYNSSASFTGAKTAIVKTMTSEYRLRNLNWIEGMRKKVEQATNGEVGYVYVPSTARNGQTELLRQLNAQTDKKGLIIDERFNDGGQIPDRFVELLDRPPLAYWATRDGEPWPWPPYSNFGPKVMLINGWSGSGGDAFPDFFRKRGIGPLIGARTWGGLIGISGCPGLIDGGTITVPTFRMYNIDGTWFKEGHGVDPDIKVPEDLTALSKGDDTQLDRAITEMQDLIKTKGFKPPKRPAPENRN